MTKQWTRAITRFALPITGITFTLYSYYVYIFHLCFVLIEDKHQLQLYNGVAVLLLAACLGTYLRLLLSHPGHPLDVPTNEEHRYSPDVSKGPYMRMVQLDGRPAWCDICQCMKPDRTHHCRQCNICILKMDHHCFFIAGCVGLGNQRLFLQFLVYTTAYALWLFLTGAPLAANGIVAALGPLNLTLLWKLYKIYLFTLLSIICNTYRVIRDRKLISLLAGVRDWATIDPLWLAFIVLGPLFSAVLLAFTCLQTYYTLRNVTSIEQISQRSYRVRVDFDEQGNDCEVIVLEPRTRLWDCGLWNNWCNVMGQWPWSWIVPFGSKSLRAVGVYNAERYQEIIHMAITKRKRKNSNSEE